MNPISPPYTVLLSFYQFKVDEGCTCAELVDREDLSHDCIKERYDIKCQSRHLKITETKEIKPESDLSVALSNMTRSDAVMLRWMTYNS